MTDEKLKIEIELALPYGTSKSVVEHLSVIAKLYAKDYALDNYEKRLTELENRVREMSADSAREKLDPIAEQTYKTLVECNWNKTMASKRLCIAYGTLERRIEKYGLGK